MLSSFRSLAWCLVASSLLAPALAGQSSRADIPAVDHSDLKRAWDGLASKDAAEAYRAIWTFRRMPGEAVAFLAAQQPAAARPDSRQVQQWIKELDSKHFAVREAAYQRLELLEGRAESALRKASQGKPPLEVRRRIEKLLDKLAGPLTLPEQLRAARAVEILEYTGTAEATKLLRAYAAGAEGARLTRDAQAALSRLEKRPALGNALAEKRPLTDLYGDPLPASAVARLGTIRFRSEGRLVGFLEGDKNLLTVGEYDIQIWQVADGKLLREFATGSIMISATVLSPDRKRLVVGVSFPSPAPKEPGPAEVRVIDLESGKVLQTLPRKNVFDVAYSKLAMSPDGKLLFSLTRAGVFRVEDITSAKTIATRTFSRDDPDGIAVSPDGEYVAIAAGINARKAYLWKWRNGEPRELKGFERGAQGVCFSPDGKLLAGIESYRSLKVWEVPGGRLAYQREFPDRDYYFSGGPAFTPDGKTLAVSANHRHGSGRALIELLEPATGRSQGTLPGSLDFAISSDSRCLACNLRKGMRIYDLGSRKQMNELYEAHEGDLSQIVISSQDMIVTASEDNTVRIWDTATSRQRRKLAFDRWVRAIDLSPDGSLLAASSMDDAVHVWEPSTGREIYRLAGHGKSGGRRTLSFLPDGQGLLSWGDDRYLRLWDMKTGKARFEHAIRPDGVTVAEYDRDLSGRGMPRGPGEAAVSPDGARLVLDDGGHIHVFDIASGKQKAKISGHRELQTVMGITPDSKSLLTSGWGDRRENNHPLALTDLSSGRQIWRMELAGSEASPIAFSRDGRMFATTVAGATGYDIVVYEMASATVRHTIRGVRWRVHSLAFFPDGRRLASGHSDSTILIWDLAVQPVTANGP